MDSLDKIHKLEEELNSLKKRINKEIDSLQDKCSHKNIAEAGYIPSSYWRKATPPIRICLDCGLTEDGWGCGYKILRTENPSKIDRNILYSKRKGKYYFQE